MQKGVFVKMHQIYVFYLYVVFNVPVYGNMYIYQTCISVRNPYLLFFFLYFVKNEQIKL